jgi:hypothetical protein
MKYIIITSLVLLNISCQESRKSKQARLSLDANAAMTETAVAQEEKPAPFVKPTSIQNKSRGSPVAKLLDEASNYEINRDATTLAYEVAEQSTDELQDKEFDEMLYKIINTKGDIVLNDEFMKTLTDKWQSILLGVTPEERLRMIRMFIMLRAATVANQELKDAKDMQAQASN